MLSVTLCTSIHHVESKETPAAVQGGPARPTGFSQNGGSGHFQARPSSRYDGSPVKRRLRVLLNCARGAGQRGRIPRGVRPASLRPDLSTHARNGIRRREMGQTAEEDGLLG